jgi:hypothetical protein
MNDCSCPPVVATTHFGLTRSPRKAALAFALAITPLLSTVAFTAEAGCTDPNAKAKPGATGLMSAQNFGIYDWDESTQVWVLDQAGYAPFAETETLQSGDFAIPASTFGGGSVGGGDGTQINLQADGIRAGARQGSAKTGAGSRCDEIHVMPATVDIDFRPADDTGLMRLTIFRAVGDGG